MGVTLVIILVNVGVSMLAFSAFQKNDRTERFIFQPSRLAGGRNQLGFLLSHFSHADIGHLLFNMITLFFFGPVIEGYLGAADLLTVYVLSGLFASLLIFLLQKKNPSYRALGASGSISGVVFAAIIVNPAMNIYLFFIPIPIPAPLFAVAYLGLSAYLMRRETGNISHEAHLGGALAGLLLGGFLSPRGFAPLMERFLG